MKRTPRSEFRRYDRVVGITGPGKSNYKHELRAHNRSGGWRDSQRGKDGDGSDVQYDCVGIARLYNQYLWSGCWRCVHIFMAWGLGLVPSFYVEPWRQVYQGTNDTKGKEVIFLLAFTMLKRRVLHFGTNGPKFEGGSVHNPEN